MELQRQLNPLLIVVLHSKRAIELKVFYIILQTKTILPTQMLQVLMLIFILLTYVVIERVVLLLKEVREVLELKVY